MGKEGTTTLVQDQKVEEKQPSGESWGSGTSYLRNSGDGSKYFWMNF